MNSQFTSVSRTLVALILRVLTMLDDRGVADVKIRWLLGEGQETFNQIFNDAVSTLEKGWIDYVQKKFREIIHVGLSFETDKRPFDGMIQTLGAQHPTISHLFGGHQLDFDHNRSRLTFVTGLLCQPVTLNDLISRKFYLTGQEFVRFLLQMEDVKFANELCRLYPDGIWVLIKWNASRSLALKSCVVNGVVSIKAPESDHVLLGGEIAANQAILLPYRG